jgi:hypothetical protein
MSYSYIKSVFPNYEPSVSNNKHFNSLPPVENKTTNIQHFEANNQDDYYKFAKSLISEAKAIETFTPDQHEHGLCDKYMSHVLQCTQCKDHVLTQFTQDKDKIRNEEIMEILSYIVFGIFVLLLIDALRKN